MSTEHFSTYGTDNHALTAHSTVQSLVSLAGERNSFALLCYIGPTLLCRRNSHFLREVIDHGPGCSAPGLINWALDLGFQRDKQTYDEFTTNFPFLDLYLMDQLMLAPFSRTSPKNS